MKIPRMLNMNLSRAFHPPRKSGSLDTADLNRAPTKTE